MLLHAEIVVAALLIVGAFVVYGHQVFKVCKARSAVGVSVVATYLKVLSSVAALAALVVWRWDDWLQPIIILPVRAILHRTEVVLVLAQVTTAVLTTGGVHLVVLFFAWFDLGRDALETTGARYERFVRHPLLRRLSWYLTCAATVVLAIVPLPLIIVFVGPLRGYRVYAASTLGGIALATSFLTWMPQILLVLFGGTARNFSKLLLLGEITGGFLALFFQASIAKVGWEVWGTTLASVLLELLLAAVWMLRTRCVDENENSF